MQMCYNKLSSFLKSMSEEQLTALLDKIKGDADLSKKLHGAADIDAALALIKEAGFDVSKAELLKAQASQTLELSDEELDAVVGGENPTTANTSCEGCSSGYLC